MYRTFLKQFVINASFNKIQISFHEEVIDVWNVSNELFSTNHRSDANVILSTFDERKTTVKPKSSMNIYRTKTSIETGQVISMPVQSDIYEGFRVIIFFVH